ncbi:MAG TPA: carboxypeptidase-like regulatory domain-containing protein, partial [Bryobacteraceae bacterium]|nr:carboxypeptidase-like regulatory domain-containing protein [Bryobacteraceae bacterium]
MCRLFFLCAATFAPALVLAQETINHASLAGRVTDPSGAVVENAEVTARHVETNQRYSAQSDSEGRFRFTYLRVGSYEVAVRHLGFADSLKTITVNVGGTYDLAFTLAVGATETRVNVVTDATVLETARSQITGAVSQTEIRELPLNGRNFLDLALLVPGVSPTNTGSNQLFAETSAVPGQGISVGSQR